MFVYVVHPRWLIAEVQRLCDHGVPLRAIGRRTGVATGTIRRWRQRGFPQLAESAHAWFPGRDYAYALGLYLGDGCLQLPGRCQTHTLDIACDGQYTSITREIAGALERVFPPAPARVTPVRDSRGIRVRITHAGVISAFPQHGPGRKHERKIELVEWQRVLTHRHPDAFIRGLIHSDGSRCINQVNTRLPSGRDAHYEYVRYFFTNYSADIRQIFCEHCELLGIRWTRSNSRNISISHRDSVAILEEIVGPKS